MLAHLRIARPVSSLQDSVAMYQHGLELQELARFDDHEGFDGVMLGRTGLGYHFEFTYCRHHPIVPAPTPEDLLVFYVPDREEWRRICSRMLHAGFVEVVPFNDYWQQRGRCFADLDGYHVVLEQATWRNELG